MNPFLQLLQAARRNGKNATADEKAAVETAQSMSRNQLRRALRDPSVSDQKRMQVLLPSAREVFACRIVDAEGRTQPWPPCKDWDEARRLMDRRLAARGLR